MKLTNSANVAKKEHQLLNGNRLILLDILGEAANYEAHEQSRNVFLLSPSGEEIWRVADHTGIDGGDPFVGISVGEDGKIIGGTWEGWHFEIDAKSGSLKKLGWSK